MGTVGRSLAMALLLVTILTISLATIYSSPVSDNRVSCPEGWVDANDLDMGCLLMHHSELNHKVHTWPKSDEFCREFGENSRMVEVHTIKQEEFLDQLVLVRVTTTTGLEQLIRKMRVTGSGAQQGDLESLSRTLSGLQS